MSRVNTRNAMGLILLGKSALHGFRSEVLLKRIASSAPGLRVTAAEARFVYFLASDSPLAGDVVKKASALLSASETMRGASVEEGFFVIPRKGTISPWSSKAGDIFRNCGLSSVVRVERGILYRLLSGGRALSREEAAPVAGLVHDRMTEGVYSDVSDMFDQMEPMPCVVVDILSGGRDALTGANTAMGLALSDEEIDYLYGSYRRIGRNPTDVELVMFGQVNSEHCRHKIFKADWIVDGERKDMSLFAMIRNTHARNPAGTLSAYEDNAAVIEGFRAEWFEAFRGGGPAYEYGTEQVEIVAKVETHNHPTAISPFPGAATGIGGEIRDEAATGVGGRSKAGLCGFMVSNLRIPGMPMPWEKEYAGFPRRLATPLEIMTDGPLGGAAFGNEFGRPQLCGFFRTYEEEYNGRYRGYHKPIMVAGGVGVIKRRHVAKKRIPSGAAIVQIGGPAMRIGLGGGAASSMAVGSNAENLDFDSVQRDNAEMQRRCQQVIDACIAKGEGNPILSIHDLGAGGLSNGCPELVAETGGRFRLREVHNEELSMSPMEVWCCEAQERYVLALSRDALDDFIALCARERCPVATIGEATGDGRLTLYDAHFDNTPIDIELRVILGKPPKMLRDARRRAETHAGLDFRGVSLSEAVNRVLHLPAVANKTFLITITDRTVMGMTARDQMTGPFQVPISDAAVNTVSYRSNAGSAMAMGERPVIALVSAAASGRMAVCEALTNICAADVGRIGNVKLSANWMCACGEAGEDASLFETVRAVGMELCPALGVSIPVGKDSLSMRTLWRTPDGRDVRMTAPMSLVISAFAPVRDVMKTVTPDLKNVPGSELIFVDLGRGRNRLGCSALAQVFNQVGGDCADAERPDDVRSFFAAIQQMVDGRLLLAYHDRSDGGLFCALAEMAFGGRRGITARLDGLGADPLSILFSEELGAVLQVAGENVGQVMDTLKRHSLEDVSRVIGHPADDRRLTVEFRGKTVFAERVSVLNRMWSETTFKMQELRDNPECAKEEYDGILDEDDPGMTFHATFEPDAVFSIAGNRPPFAILREQGVNGHVEMAAAFDRAGFDCIDVHMTDLLSGRVKLDGFTGFAACGGFSYGDVLGAGAGWAQTILFNERLRDSFARFFARPDTFALGVCNGCQMLSQLKEIVPGAAHWPRFARNRSQRFEARYVTVEVRPSPSVFLKGMEGSMLGIPVAHGEGFADFAATGSLDAAVEKQLVCMRYVDNRGEPSERYPSNPNGSPGGITGLTTSDGRVTVMMPHPERGFRSVQMSYRPEWWTFESGPWMEMFRNARRFAAGR